MPSTKLRKTRKNSHHKKTSKRVQHKRAHSKRTQHKRAQHKRTQSKRVQNKRSTRKRYGGYGEAKTYETLDKIRDAILSNKKLFMLIGHGASNMFGNREQYEAAIEDIAKKIKTTDGVMGKGRGAALLYFGDSADEKNPDVGLAFKLLKEKLKQMRIYMIQIDKAKDWGVPEFVEGVFWHNDYDKQEGASQCVWGGFDEQGQPCSNTKKWVDLVTDLKSHYEKYNRGIDGVSTLFVLGGGPITVKEMDLAARMGIPMDYYPLVRMKMGDEEGKPYVGDTQIFKETIGPSLEKAEELSRQGKLNFVSVEQPSEHPEYGQFRDAAIHQVQRYEKCISTCKKQFPIAAQQAEQD